MGRHAVSPSRLQGVGRSRAELEFGTGTTTGTSNILEVPVVNGGPSRTRTLDPLIKSLQTAAREIEHFSCRRHVSRMLQSVSEWHVSQNRAILASTSAN